MRNSVRKIAVVAGAVCASAVFSSCKNNGAQADVFKDGSEVAWAPTDNDRKLSDTMNGFGFNLLKKFDAEKKPDQNILFSPLSIATALTLVEQGAAGQTRTEMQSLLQPAGFAAQNVLGSSMALTRGWQTADAGVQVDIANSMWLDKKFALKPAFVQMAKKNFDAETATLDFLSPAAAAQINDWVSGKTHDKIKNMVSAGALQNEMLLIANAVYFRGKWQYPFDKTDTQDGDFHLASGKTRRVPMMSLQEKKAFSYAKADKVALLSLPYGKGALSMIFLLPGKNVSLSQIVARLEDAQWKTWMESLKVQEGTVQIPRFTLESDTSLNQMLQQLGMKAAFSSAADFSAMTATRGAFISGVKHKAWMQVDESGTEAAASTTIGVAGSANPAAAPPPFEFIADRPFIAAIRDNRSGNLLFLAEVNQPSQ